MYPHIPVEVLNGDHALFSPSGAKRWMSCPASVLRQMGLESPSSKAAMIGTAAHWVLEMGLVFGIDADFFGGMLPPNEVTVDADMVSNVQFALDWVNAEKAGCELKVESRVDIYKALWLDIPLIYGTVDIQLLGSGDTLTIADYKNGKSPVKVVDNNQLELYALGALHELDYAYEKVRMVITQPRNGGIKIHETTTEELTNKRLIYWAAIQAGLDPNAEAVPSGDNCYFCTAKSRCPEYMAYKNRDIIDLFNSVQQ